MYLIKKRIGFLHGNEGDTPLLSFSGGSGDRRDGKGARGACDLRGQCLRLQLRQRRRLKRIAYKSQVRPGNVHDFPLHC